MKRKYLVDTKLSLLLAIMVLVSYSLIYMTKNCYSAAMASIVAEKIMTKSQTGLITAAFYIVYAPLQVVGGFAADKYSPHKLIIIGTVGAGVANLLIYFTQSYVAMLIIWSLNGLAQFGIWPSVFKIISSELTEKHSVLALVYVGLATVLGTLLSYILAVFVSNWKNNFLISSIVLFVVTVVFYISYTRVEKEMVVETVPVAQKTKDLAENNQKQKAFWLILKSGVPIMFVVYIIHNMLNLGIKSVAPVMLMENYNGVNPSLANAFNIFLILSGVVGIFVASIKCFRRFSPTTVVAGFFVIILPLLFVVSKIGRLDIAIIIASLSVCMLSFAASAVAFHRISRAFAPYGCAATVSGIFNCMASIGLVLSNFLFTRFSDDYGWAFTTRFWFVLMTVALVLCIIAIPLWKKFAKTL